MTLLGAYADSPTRIIVGADRLEASTDDCLVTRATRGDKWHQVSHLPLAWGWSGSGANALTMGAVMAALPAESTWESATATIRGAVAECNVGPSEKAIAVMAAGFLGGVPGIIAVSSGAITNWPDRRLDASARFMGHSAWGIHLAWTWLTEHDADRVTPEAFVSVMETAVSFNPYLLDFCAWEITEAGLTLIHHSKPMPRY